MNITIIHGDNSEASYNYLSSIRDRIDNTSIKVHDDKSQVSLQEFFRSKDMFSSEIKYVVNDIDKIANADIKWLATNSTQFDIDVYMYSAKKLSASFIAKLPKPAKVQVFDHPQLMWKFLESIYPGNSKQSLLLLSELTKTEPIEKTFSLTINQIKDLYLSAVDSELLQYPSWRASKLKLQSSKFDLAKLNELIYEFSEIDLRSKRGEQLYDLFCFSFIKLL